MSRHGGYDRRSSACNRHHYMNNRSLECGTYNVTARAGRRGSNIHLPMHGSFTELPYQHTSTPHCPALTGHTTRLFYSKRSHNQLYRPHDQTFHFPGRLIFFTSCARSLLNVSAKNKMRKKTGKTKPTNKSLYKKPLSQKCHVRNRRLGERLQL